MDQPKAPSSLPIDGHMAVLGPAHSIAIYERNGDHYVAEFRDGWGEFTEANSWFHLNAAALRYRRALEPVPFSEPLDAGTFRRIERLHAESDARQERMPALPRGLAARARDCLASLLSRLRGREPVERMRVPSR